MINLIKKYYSRFLSWMEYNPPGALSSKGWRLFNREFEEVAPIRFFLSRTVRSEVAWPIKHVFSSIFSWIEYRTVDRNHVLKIGLPPGLYDAPTKMLHVNFTLLKDFVEIEQAWLYSWSDSDNRPKFWRRIPIVGSIRRPRRPDLGIKYNEWAATLDDPSIPPASQAPEQAATAREILQLYHWWVRDRPMRKLQEDIVYDNQGLGTLACFDDDFDSTSPDYTKHMQTVASNVQSEIEWEEEDDLMLHRLIKIRQRLWT